MTKKKPARKLTQNDEAQAEISRLLGYKEQLESIEKNLRDVLSRAQNSAPYGEADGSISIQAYADLRRVEQALKALLREARAAHWSTRDA